VSADSLDEASQPLSDALVGTLDGALDDRDAIVATIGGLGDYSDYDVVLEDVVETSDEEAEAFAEGVEDDTLVPSAGTALTDAEAQATATSEAAASLADSIDPAAADDDEEAEDEDCPRGGPGGRRGGPRDPQEAPSFRP
jgi:hypothetical protein